MGKVVSTKDMRNRSNEGEKEEECSSVRLGKLGRGLSASSNPARGGISSRTVIMYKL